MSVITRAEGFGLEVLGREGAARRARLTTPHGVIETPTFMPVATYGAVRGVSFQELAEAGAQILLSNTYHLHERPGEETVEALGGLHGFTGWEGPWLTDSGGFQVTSLSDRAKIDETGVTFTSPLDGRRRQLTPENTIAIQEALGSDIAMVLDECLPVDHDEAGRTTTRAMQRAMERTLRWAERAQKARRRPSQAVFAIVQGGASETLRRASAESTAQIEFDGYAHGGLGLGESREERRAAVAAAFSTARDTDPSAGWPRASTSSSASCRPGTVATDWSSRPRARSVCETRATPGTRIRSTRPAPARRAEATAEDTCATS